MNLFVVRSELHIGRNKNESLYLKVLNLVLLSMKIAVTVLTNPDEINWGE
jgi:hypothetical protein